MHTYILQYWHERDYKWRGAGFIGSLDECRLRMKGARQECDGCVRFRIAPYMQPVGHA